MRVRTRPVGAILAGGGGRRIGGDKAIVELHGRPLISYPLETVRLAKANPGRAPAVIACAQAGGCRRRTEVAPAPVATRT
jgi:molybdopterin-guanine dinucleotide biosynthesis protein A